jgi:molybdenum cofactor cytidylyltransferase
VKSAAVAVVLAAGAGTRFAGQGHKLDASIGDRSVLTRAVDTAVEAAVGPVVVVTAAQVTTPLPASVVHVVNDRWADGQMSSLRAGIAVATYDGHRGHPVRLAAETWDLLADDGDEGARTLMRLRPDLVTEVPCEGSSIDIDTVEDLRRWQKSSSTSSPSTGPSTKPGR